MNAKPLAGSDFAKQGVTRQDDPSVGECRNKTETVVCRQGTVTLLEDQGLRDLGGSQIVSDHASVIEVLPLLIREVEEIRSPNRQWNDQSIRQVAKSPKQSSFVEHVSSGRVDIGHE